MPIAVSYNNRQRRIVARATGVLALADFVAFIQTARSPIDYRDWPLLFDARGATTSEGSTAIDLVVDHVRIAAARERGVRNYAALVADDDGLYGLFLTYETHLVLAGLPVVRVFRQKPDALKWLDTMASARRFQAD